MVLKKDKLVYLAGTFATAIVCGLWSLGLFYEWGSDFGLYYAGAYFLDNDYRLYQEFFDHKGPCYYIFIKFISFFIGWGFQHSAVVLFSSVFIFYIAFIYILIKEGVKGRLFLICISLSLLFLHIQSTNASIAFFLSALLITSLYFLVRGKGAKGFLISVFFYSLAIYTRIDTLIFFPVFLIGGYRNLSLRGIQNKLFTFIALAIPGITLMLMATYLNFSISQFYLANIEFNNWYGSKSLGAWLYRPFHLGLLLQSMILIPFITLGNQKYSYLIIYKEFKDHGLKLGLEKYYTQVILLLILMLSIVGLLIAGSDKDYYALILMAPLLFLIALGARDVFNGTISGSVFMLIVLYSTVLLIYPYVKKLKDNPECLSDHFCTASPLSLYEEDLLSISGYKDYAIVGGRGWTYLYLDRKPNRTINDWWIYYRNEAFLTPELLEQSEDLLSKSEGFPIYIDNDLLSNLSKRTPEFHKLLSRASFQERFQRYSLYKLKGG